MTNKEIAERLRHVASGDPGLVTIEKDTLKKLADELDPPPLAPGTVVQFTESGDYGIIGSFGHIHTQHSAITDPRPYKPARIAGQMQEIVDIPPVSQWPRGASAVNAVYETDYIGTTYIGEIITRTEAARREADQ